MVYDKAFEPFSHRLDALMQMACSEFCQILQLQRLKVVQNYVSCVGSTHSNLRRLNAINTALLLLSEEASHSTSLLQHTPNIDCYKLLCLLVSGSSLVQTLAWALPSLDMSSLKVTR